jgi:hypothetical protein
MTKKSTYKIHAEVFYKRGDKVIASKSVRLTAKHIIVGYIDMRWRVEPSDAGLRVIREAGAAVAQSAGVHPTQIGFKISADADALAARLKLAESEAATSISMLDSNITRTRAYLEQMLKAQGAHERTVRECRAIAVKVDQQSCATFEEPCRSRPRKIVI